MPEGVAEGKRVSCQKWVEDTDGNAWRCCPICWLLRVAPGGRVEEVIEKGCWEGLSFWFEVGVACWLLDEAQLLELI